MSFQDPPSRYVTPESKQGQSGRSSFVVAQLAKGGVLETPHETFRLLAEDGGLFSGVARINDNLRSHLKHRTSNHCTIPVYAVDPATKPEDRALHPMDVKVQDHPGFRLQLYGVGRNAREYIFRLVKVYNLLGFSPRLSLVAPNLCDTIRRLREEPAPCSTQDTPTTPELDKPK